jgi:hypothetical protein
MNTLKLFCIMRLKKRTFLNLTDDKLNKAYEYITNEEDARVCRDISDKACKYVPKNFFTIIFSNTLTKIGDVLTNPKTVLTWIMYLVNAPVSLIGFLVPIRESGSMLPQLFISSYVRKLPRRKWVWITGSLLQATSVVLIGITVLTLSGLYAGIAIIILLILFSLARGLCSISSKDVLGKTIPKTRRGLLNGLSATISGVIGIITGLVLLTIKENDSDLYIYGILIFTAAAFWFIASIVYSRVEEFPGETEGGGNAFSEAIKRFSILKTDFNFRNFVLARALFLGSSLASPYYVLLAQKQFGNQSKLLGVFIIASGVASSISASIWGKYSDKSSKNVMILGTWIASVLGVIIFTIAQFMRGTQDFPYLYPIAFFILSVAHAGVRIGRKTYIVDMAGGNKRTDYIAVSNTSIGLILLLTGIVGIAASMVSLQLVIFCFAILGFGGIIIAKKLPDVE